MADAAANFWEESFSIARLDGLRARWWNRERGPEGAPGYCVCRTRLGYVLCYAEPGETVLSMSHDGREFRRIYRREYSGRYLMTLARRFAADAVNSEIPF